MSKFVFITDPHFRLKSNVRTGNLLDDIRSKLSFVVDFCNQHDAPLLIGGDTFDSPVAADETKNAVFSLLSKVNKGVYDIQGNHCILYNSREYTDRTSYGTLRLFNWFHDLDLKDYDFGDCVLTSQVPIIDKGKPQIVIRHAFYQVMEDKEWTFYDSDIQTDDQCFILLGHDHTPYPPVTVRNSTIFRIGSFLRQTRDKNSYRTPQLLLIECDSERGLYAKSYDIPSRPAEEIFNAKLAEATQDKHETYESIIAMIQQSANQELTLEQALQQVTDDTTTRYLMNLLQTAQAQQVTKKSKI